MSTASTAWTTITTTMRLTGLCLTGLCLTGLTLAGCDPSDEPTDDGVAQPAETEGASETDGATAGATATEGDPTEGDPPPAETEGDPTETETEGEDAPGPGAERGAARACTTDDGMAGTQFCDELYHSGEAVQQWGPCLTELACEVGESRSCFGDCGEGEDSGGMCDIYETCGLYGGEPAWDTNQGDWDGCNTPLVLSFDGRPARMTAARAATFDLD